MSTMRERLAAWRQEPHRLRRIVRLAAVVGVLAVALETATVATLTAVDRRRRRRRPPALFPHSALPTTASGDDTFEVYTYGRDLYDAMLAAIDAAKEAVYLETYIWKNDAIGAEFKRHLIRKAEEGVPVYVVYDFFGNLVVPRSFLKFPPSVHALAYRGIRRPRHLLRPRRYALDHRKLLIVDGTTAFIGGYNIGDLYATDWRDTHLRIMGPSAAALAQAFVDFWNRNGHESDPIERRYHRGFDTRVLVRSNDAMRLTFPIRDTYLNGFDAAEKTIRMTSAYFIPDHVLLESMAAAVRRGVDVQVLVPWESNHIVADWASHAYFTRCLEAGIKIYGYQHAMIHAKTATADSQVTTIGSANIDRLSSVGNYEINVAIASPGLAQQMEDIFETDKTNAFELTLDQWRSRPWYVKASEQVIKPLRFVL